MKRKPTSEAPNEVVAPSDLGVEDGGGVQVENFEGTQLRESASEEPRVEDSEEEDEEENEGGKDAAVPLVAEGGQQPLVLAENFYEVEAIRRKRVRKGQLQYYIKWRDWPETANTWEPPENLESVPDVIEAFEESCPPHPAGLKSGKHRKRRRKHVVHHHTQPKKRLERSTTPYSLRRFSTKTAEKHTQSAPLNDPILTDVPAFPQTVLFADEMGNGGNGSGLGKSTDCDANKAVNGSEQNIVRNEENDYDPKLSELKAMGANGNDTDKLAIQFPEDKISPGSNCQTDGIPKGDCSDTVRGSKRRKSGSVKRFKRESHTGEPANTVEQEQARNPNSGGGADHASPASNIVRIIRPIGYSTSVASGMQDVLVTFVASRSDGKEVMVNNDQLKKINPILGSYNQTLNSEYSKKWSLGKNANQFLRAASPLQPYIMTKYEDSELKGKKCIVC